MDAQDGQDLTFGQKEPSRGPLPEILLQLDAWPVIIAWDPAKGLQV